MIAATSLGVAPTDFPPFILESVLPQVPKNQKISTKLLLLQKFEIEKSCEEFLNFCNRERGFEYTDLEDDACLASAIVSMVRFYILFIKLKINTQQPSLEAKRICQTLQ